MPTTELDGLVTRTTVILEKPADWEEWIFLRKDSANRNHLWPMVNPDLDEEALEQLEEPEPVIPEQYHEVTEQDTGVVLRDMTTEEFQRYQQAERGYDRALARYTVKRKALDDFTQEIGRTISRRHIHLIQSDDTAYARLKRLKKHLCPSTAERELQLLTKYRQLQSRPRNNIDTWLDEWLHVVRLCEAANLPDVTSPRAQRDFLLAVKGLDDTWATTQQANLFEAQIQGQSVKSLDDLIAQFTMYWRSTRPVASSHGTFATLGISQDEPQATENKDKREQDKKPKCVCGLNHRFKDCWYLGAKGKPQGWTPKPEIQEQFDKAMASRSTFGAAMKAALKANTNAVKARDHAGTEASAASTAPRQFDDHTPTFDTLNSHVSQLTMSSDCASEQTVKPSLINRWILDPGSNTHVTNSRAYELLIHEWGDVILLINTPRGTEQIELTYVAYVPGFLTNVVGLSRCRSIGIHFDSGRDCLYQKSWKNVVCKLNYTGGHWLIDAE
ncbi:hypothetical protein BU23DRAFT_466927, partial [Bimuria novae-zelandiae CBS 107.79]